MKTQISRDSFRPVNRYSGVYQQQGRMLTDADWNELMDVVKTRIDEVIRDAIGSGAPRDRGLGILDGFMIQPGHLYVDGIHAEIPGTTPIAFDDQPDFSEAQALPLGGGGGRPAMSSMPMCGNAPFPPSKTRSFSTQAFTAPTHAPGQGPCSR